MQSLLEFLRRLDESKIWYRLERVRDALMVEVAVPGERWEVEFFPDEHVEVERFVSDGEILGVEALDELLSRHGN
jgi:hypothetical protein